MEADPDVYNHCAECDLAVVEDALEPDDRAALALYTDLARPVVKDLALVGVVFDAWQLRMTAADVQDLLVKLDLIHQHRLTTSATAGPDGAPT